MRSRTEPVARPSVDAARTGSSPGCDVVIVGASVDPYVRFTTHPNAALARSTNAGVTPAPPDDTRRRLATEDGENAGASISPTKNVGGPIMKVIRSRSINSSAAVGSHFAMSTLFIGTTPGTVTPLS